MPFFPKPSVSWINKMNAFFQLLTAIFGVFAHFLYTYAMDS